VGEGQHRQQQSRGYTVRDYHASADRRRLTLRAGTFRGLGTDRRLLKLLISFFLFLLFFLFSLSNLLYINALQVSLL
jgi:hypothetical protein